MNYLLSVYTNNGFQPNQNAIKSQVNIAKSVLICDNVMHIASEKFLES